MLPKWLWQQLTILSCQHLLHVWSVGSSMDHGHIPNKTQVQGKKTDF